MDYGPFTRYLEILENHCNDGTLKLEYKDLMDKKEVNYNSVEDKLKLKESKNLEYPILEFKSKIEELKDWVIVTKSKYVVPGKVSGYRIEIDVGNI